MEEQKENHVREKVEQTLERIEQFRKQKGFSYENMGNEIGKSASGYRKIVKNESKIKLETLFLIAKELGVSVSELVEGNAHKENKHHHKGDVRSFNEHQEFQNLHSDQKKPIQQQVDGLELRVTRLEDERGSFRNQSIDKK